MKPDSGLRRNDEIAARLAIASMFLIHGLVTGAWVPHIPLAQQRLGADLATFGLALLAMAAGAVTAMPVAGALIHKAGSARVALVTGILFCLAFPMPALAGTIGWFVAGLAIFGATIGAMDVAINAQALAYEKHIGRPVMSLFHGMYSAGAMGGAGVSALVLGRFSVQTHLAGTVVIGLATMGAAAFFLLPADTDRGLEKRFFAWPSRATIGLGGLCFLAYMSEGAVLDWSAIELRQKFSLSAHVAGIGSGGCRHGHCARRPGCGDLHRRLRTGGAGPRQHRAGAVERRRKAGTGGTRARDRGRRGDGLCRIGHRPAIHRPCGAGCRPVGGSRIHRPCHDHYRSSGQSGRGSAGLKRIDQPSAMMTWPVWPPSTLFT